MKRLKQRYDFVARGVVKSKAPKPATSASQEVVRESTNTDNNPRARGKPRPMSSKPRKPSAKSTSDRDNEKVKKKVTMREDDIVEEDFIDEDGVDDADNDDDKDGIYDRQKTRDIGFDMPADDDDDENGGKEDDIEDDY